MADLPETAAAIEVKIMGQDTTGLETNAVDATTFGLKVDVQASVLPTGASTAANQATANASLSSIDAGTPAALGQTTMSASMPVVIASDQTAVPVSRLDTAATATITALDTATSNLTGANGQVFYFNSPTTNSAAVFALASHESVTLQANLLGAGGTMVIEVSSDGGTFWIRPNTFQPGTQNYANSFTSPFVAVVNVAGMTHVRVRGTVSWAGTATILAKETMNERAVTIGEALPPGANAIGSVTVSSSALPTGAATSANQTTELASLSSIDSKTPALVSGRQPVDGSGVTQPISATSLPLPTGAATSALQTTGNSSLSSIDGKMNSLGQKTMANSMPVVIASDQSAIPVTGTTTSNPGYGVLAAYSASASAFAPAANATDVFTIRGSATKTVRVSLVSISATTTAGSGIAVNISLTKRSAANTAGTFVSDTIIPHDSNDAASTSAVGHYTANPTGVGAAVGSVRVIRQTAATAGTVNNITTWDFGTRPAKPIVLRGTSEFLCVNFGTTTITGGIVSIYVEFTEE